MWQYVLGKSRVEESILKSGCFDDQDCSFDRASAGSLMR